MIAERLVPQIHDEGISDYPGLVGCSSFQLPVVEDTFKSFQRRLDNIVSNENAHTSAN